jgi:putative DNA primase/helicase
MPPLCSCGKNCGKHPIPPNGLKDATTELDQLHAWNERYPDANWAVRTGSESGVWVADYDGDAGREGRRAPEAEIGGLDEPAQIKTGGGGLHDLYLWPEDGESIRNSAGDVAPGVDVRGEGGYVLLPGSLHRSGNRYEAMGKRRDPAPAPEGLVS